MVLVDADDDAIVLVLDIVGMEEGPKGNVFNVIVHTQ